MIFLHFRRCPPDGQRLDGKARIETIRALSLECVQSMVVWQLGLQLYGVLGQNCRKQNKLRAIETNGLVKQNLMTGMRMNVGARERIRFIYYSSRLQHHNYMRPFLFLVD
jgi:hypothetical protein